MHNTDNYNSTVAAISTPHGKGGIAIIRISGDDAVKIASEIFIPHSKTSLAQAPNAKLLRGDIMHEGRVIDDGLAAVFHAPASYTGEDMVEINCHGGVLLSRLVLEAALMAGAVPAGPGEFTKRAFISGKLALSQAEAVINLIDAESTEKIKLASAQAKGALYRKVTEISNSIRTLVADMYVYIDYPDEDLTDTPPDEAIARLCELERSLSSLADTYHTGRAVCEGISAVICGKPNTGKSSLLNLILGENRAIVTDIAGTTRDTVEETASLGRVLLRLCDTAGIHEADSLPEQLGIDRSLEKIDSAELILSVFDGSRPLEGEDYEVIDRINAAKVQSDCEIIAIINKSDIGLCDATSEHIKNTFENCLTLSAKSGDSDAKSAISELVDSLFTDKEIVDYNTSAVISGARMYASVKSALDRIRSAKDALMGGLTQDIAGLDLELALSDLNEADGRQVSEDIVADIFGRFCIGK